MTINRRDALSFLCAATLGATAFPTPRYAHAAQDEPPKTGSDDAAFASFDTLISGFMREHKVPGGSLAVVRRGRLVYARGYGWADEAVHLPYAPTALFRIASVSKPVTSTTVLLLVQQNKLRLDDRAFDLLKMEPYLEPNTNLDPRIKTITVRQLLQHSGGFDRGVSFDPMFVPHRIAGALKVSAPPSSRDIVRYMLGRSLDFDPGTRFAYSNFGYCVLGRIIETRTGESYEAFVQKNVLKPVGISRMRIGKSRLADRAPNEVRYYDEGKRRVPSIFAEDRGAIVPIPYGGWCIEAMDAHGDWLASAVDLARFAALLDAKSEIPLSFRSRDQLYERPAPPLGVESDGTLSPAYYGMGWHVRPVSGKLANYWHTGKLDGSSSLLVRRYDGISWVLNFNTESVAGSLVGLLDGPLHGAANSVRAWPAHDLFTQFGITG